MSKSWWANAILVIGEVEKVERMSFNMILSLVLTTLKIMATSNRMQFILATHRSFRTWDARVRSHLLMHVHASFYVTNS